MVKTASARRMLGAAKLTRELFFIFYLLILFMNDAA
jgi:hypothetical protein